MRLRPGRGSLRVSRVPDVVLGLSSLLGTLLDLPQGPVSRSDRSLDSGLFQLPSLGDGSVPTPPFLYLQALQLSWRWRFFVEGEAVILALFSAASGKRPPVSALAQGQSFRTHPLFPDSFPGRFLQLLPVPIAFPSFLPDSSKLLPSSRGEEDDGQGRARSIEILSPGYYSRPFLGKVNWWMETGDRPPSPESGVCTHPVHDGYRCLRDGLH